MKFTDRAIRALKPRTHRYEVIEDGRTGLRCRVAPTGRKSWLLVYRKEGKLNYVTLGIYPALSLKGARTAVAELKRQWASTGIDPAQRRRTERGERIRSPTVKQLND